MILVVCRVAYVLSPDHFKYRNGGATRILRILRDCYSAYQCRVSPPDWISYPWKNPGFGMPKGFR